ncbi:MAG: hypothetical protein FJ315_06800 [SAR202 cluster bacterium]|nr:hypothetical protein [SAR202 cluster bacterium]
MISLRDRTVLQRLGTPFDTAPHTANVRNVFSPRPEQATRAVSPGGRHNIHNVGIFVWRLQSYPVARAEARLVAPGRYTFNPFGLDAPLFNPPMTEPQVTSPEQEVNLPGPLSREALRAEAEALREGRTTGRRSQACYLGTQPVFQVFLNERAEPVAPEALDIADLTNWAPPPDSKRYLNPGAGESTSFTIAAAVDPELGRITVPEGPPPLRVEVGYSYGFSSDLGGGTYQRAEVTPPERAWTAKVSHHPQSGAASSAWFSTLGEALAAWGRSEQDGDIEVSDSAIYDLGGTATIRLVRGRRLVIRAFEGRRPCLVGNLVVAGDESDTGITLSGLLLDGSVTLLGNVQPHCSHCTVRPSGSKARHSVAI